MIYAVSYLAGSVCIGFLPITDKRRALILGAFLAFISLLLMGPSKLLGMEPNLVLMGVGQFSAGFFLSLMIVPSLPQMNDVITLMIDRDYVGKERDL